MEDLKLKLAILQTAAKTKLLALNQYLSKHFWVCLIVLFMPPTILIGLLVYQSHQVEEAAQAPLLRTKQVKALKKELTHYKREVTLFQRQADSLRPVLIKQRQLVTHTTHLADSLHATLFVPPTSFRTTAELQSYLLHYHPSPDSL